MEVQQADAAEPMEDSSTSATATTTAAAVSAVSVAAADSTEPGDGSNGDAPPGMEDVPSDGDGGQHQYSGDEEFR